MKTLIKEIRESHNLNKAQFARLLNVTGATITRWEKGERTPEHNEIGALLRIAEPPQQRDLLERMGIEDTEQFAIALLAAANVKYIVTLMNREQKE